MASCRLLDPLCAAVLCSVGPLVEAGDWMAISCEAFCLADWNNDLAVSAFFGIISVLRDVPHVALLTDWR